LQRVRIETWNYVISSVYLKFWTTIQECTTLRPWGRWWRLWWWWWELLRL